jgi:Family of unknown function (DUF6516)
MIVNMDAELLEKSKQVFPGGYVAEIVVWRVPVPVPGSSHSFKYRLYFGKGGIRIVGYDNERGKGDHRHIDGRELPYTFTSLNNLLAEFWTEVHGRMFK